MVDCSQTIFVLATNAMDRDIQDFCNDKEAILSDDGELRDKAAKELSKIIKNGFRSKFGASVQCSFNQTPRSQEKSRPF